MVKQSHNKAQALSNNTLNRFSEMNGGEYKAYE